MTSPSMNIRTLKGALVSIDETNPSPKVIAFQYNPATLSRSLQPQMVGAQEGEHSEDVHFTSAPEETISLEAEIDATDALARGDATAESMGIYPQLAALELLVYPKSSQVTSAASSLAQGKIEIIQMAAPRTLFVWGAKRVLPVRLNSFTIHEEMFDADLNPIRATVSISMRVLTYGDLASSTKGYQEFLAHQRWMESVAPLATGSANKSQLGVSASQL